MPDTADITSNRPDTAAATAAAAAEAAATPHATPHAPAPERPDSVLRMPRHAPVQPFDISLDHALSAPAQAVPLDMSAFNTIVRQASAPPAWVRGHEGDTRIIHPAAHSAVLGVLALLFVACLIAYSRFGRALTSSVQDLWSVRHRQNAFDDSAVGRRRVQLLLAIQFTAYCGVLLYAAVRPGPCDDAAAALADTLRLTGLAGAYYMFQLAAYSAVGYTFAPGPEKARQWLDGFNASQGLAGAVLALPTLGLIFYPDAARTMLLAAISVYIAARLIFIGKGFRIFYTGPASLVYFILYLCTLETVPVIAVIATAQSIVGRT